MKSRIIAPIENRKHRNGKINSFDANLQALEACEKLIIDIQNYIERNDLMRDNDEESVKNIKELLKEFGL